MKRIRLERARLFGNCLVGLELWKRLGLDRFWEAFLDEEPAEVTKSRVGVLLAINR